MPFSSNIFEDLKRSNRLWAAKVNETDPNFFNESAKGQHPKVLWVGCSDSRTPESVILNRPPGDIFVHRNVGNQFPVDDRSAISVLHFAVLEVGVEHVIVNVNLIPGHTGCGAAATAYEGACGRLPIAADSTLASWLQPLVNLSKRINALHQPDPDTVEPKLLQQLVEENIKEQVKNIAQTDIMQKAWAAGKDVTIHGWLYTLDTGLVTDLNCSIGPPAKA